MLASVLISLGVWCWSEKTVSVETVTTPKVEAFYWVTITLSQTLSTALGDFADTTGLGYLGGAVIRATLFWAAFILTRPLGATVGDFLDKHHNQGGLALSRPIASLVIGSLTRRFRQAARIVERDGLLAP